MMNAIQRRGALPLGGEVPRPAVVPPVVSIGTTIAPRTRRAIWLILRSHTAIARSDLDELDRARQTVIAAATDVNAYLTAWLLNRRLDLQVLPRLNLVALLDLTARRDADGACAVAARLHNDVNLLLTLYDWVDDKKRLFESLSQDRAATVTRLYRLRRRLDALIARHSSDTSATTPDVQ